MNILRLPATEILKKYECCNLSPVEVIKQTIKQIKDKNKQLNAFSLIIDEDILLKQAKLSEERWKNNNPIGKLDGIPTTIKDGYDIAGYPTKHGSLLLKDVEPAKEDSPSVALLRDAGAIFIGKTTLPEHGTRGVTESPLTGITKNPFDSSKTSGGSSGGAAVAAATNMGLLHLAGDAGGSIRIPASFCGVYGIKPSYGFVPRKDPSLLSHFASIGTIVKYVEDAALMLDIISPKFNIDDYIEYKFSKNKQVNIAFAPTINDTYVAKDITKSVCNTAKKLTNIANIEEIKLNIPNLVECFNAHWIAAAKLYISKIEPDKLKLVDKYIIEWSKKELDLLNYTKYEVIRKNIKQQMNELLAKYDALILPTTPITAFDTGINAPTLPNGEEWQDWTPFTFPANLSGLPAASVPCGFDKDKMPIGLQIISAYSKDALVLAISKFLENT